MELGFNLVIIAILSCSANARGPLCLDCLAVRTPEECQTVTECQSTENCFTDHFLFNGEVPAFSFGCRKTQECHNTVNLERAVKFCHSCCTGDLCNNNICTNGTIPPTGIPCLDCAAVSSTDKCYHITYCQGGEVCYSEQSESIPMTYELGCLKKPVCSYFGAEIIGRRRSSTNLIPRHICCESAGCNYEGSSHQQTTTTPSPKPAKDCWDLKTIYRISEDGVYEIASPDGHMRNVSCDMTTDGGGWTVVQRRGDGRVSFNQNYESYRSLFGNLHNEFWMGNDFLHEFTQDIDQTLRVDICDWNNETRWAKYSQFSVSPASDKYRLRAGNYSGTAGDALIQKWPGVIHNWAFFSAPDVDNDKGVGDCAKASKAGWWYDYCFTANLNGLYHSESSSGDTAEGIQWETWIKLHSFKGSEMKMRPSGATLSTNALFKCPVI